MGMTWQWLGWGGACLGLSAQAAEVPDPGSLLQQQRQLQPPPVVQPAVPALASPAVATRPDDGRRVAVRGFVIEDAGALALPEAQLQALLAPAVGQALTLTELRAAIERISAAYRDAGYFLARAVLPPQDVTDGQVRVRVLEGRLAAQDGVRIQREATGTPARMDEALARAIASAPLTPGQPLRLAALERGLQLLHDTPGVAAGGNLEPGDAPGETRLVIDLADRPLLRGLVGADNFGSRYTQSNRLWGALMADNPSGFGDQAALQLVASPNRDYRYVSSRYSVLLHPGGLRLEGSASDLRYRVGEELAALDAQGAATTFGLALRYPLARSRALRLMAWAGIERKRLSNDALGTNLANKRVVLGTAGLTLEHAGATTSVLADVSAATGHLDLGRNALNLAQDQSRQGPHTQGQFAKLMGSAQVVHALTPTLSLTGQAQGQWALDNLDSGEKFILGGPTGVRAYAAGEASGDSGLRASAELRWAAWQLPNVGPLYLSAFADWGYIRQWRRPTGLALHTPNGYQLKGGGLAASLLAPSGVTASLAWARALGANPGRDPVSGTDADGQRKRSRLWLSVQGTF